MISGYFFKFEQPERIKISRDSRLIFARKAFKTFAIVQIQQNKMFEMSKGCVNDRQFCATFENQLLKIWDSSKIQGHDQLSRIFKSDDS